MTRTDIEAAVRAFAAEHGMTCDISDEQPTSAKPVPDRYYVSLTLHASYGKFETTMAITPSIELRAEHLLQAWFATMRGTKPFESEKGGRVMMRPAEPTPAEPGPMEYTLEELQGMAQKMRLVASAVYPALRNTGCHPYIEFCGLMQKYVDVCERAAVQGIQFPYANEHSGMALPVETHDLEYLAQKLRCIFGPIIDSNPEAKAIFAEALLGGHHRWNDRTGRP